MSTLSSKLQRIEENINSIRTVSGLEGRVLEEIPTEIETKFNELNTTITTKDEQITELNTTVETKDEQISSLNTTISEKDTEIETLNNTVTEKEAELTTANETIATQAAEIETLNNRIAELEGSTEPSTYQIDIAFRDSETRELLETEYTTSVSLSNADGGLIGTFTDSCAGIIIRDLAPGTYSLAFNEITTSRPDLPSYNRPENMTATIVDSDIIVDVICTKTGIVGEPAEVTYTLTDKMIPDGTVLPAGTLFGLKSIPAEKAITLDTPYDMLMSGDKLIQLNESSPLAIVQGYSDSKILGPEGYDNFEIYNTPDKQWMSNLGAYIYGVDRNSTVQDVDANIHGTSRDFQGDVFFRTTSEATITYSDVILNFGGKLLGAYYANESTGGNV